MNRMPYVDPAELPSVMQLEPYETKANCYKLVETTTKALGRLDRRERIYLKRDRANFTDGKNVHVDLDDPEAWLGTGHELSHCAFGTDPAAAQVFALKKARLLQANFAANGSNILDGQEQRVADILFRMINILDDWRVAYWWGQPFPGDYDLLLTRWERLSKIRAAGEGPKTDLIEFMLCSMMGTAPADADPEFLSLSPAIEQAFEDAMTVNFPTCMAIAGELLDKFVRILAKQLPPPQPQQPPPPPQAGQGQAGGQPGDDDDGDKGDGQSQSGDQPQGGGSAPSGDDDGSAQSAGGAGTETPREKRKRERKEAAAANKAKMEKTRTKAQAQAFRLLVLAGQFDPNNGVGDYHITKWMQDRFNEGKIPRKVEDLADSALNLDLDNAQDMDDAASQMAQIAGELKKAGEEKEKDDWLLKDAKSKIQFDDLGADSITLRWEDLSPEEQAAARKARSQFLRMMGQKRNIIRSSGTTVRMSSAIQRRFTKSGPVFKGETKTRGLDYLTIIDGSGSMIGPRFAAVSRAEIMLRHSLDFPFVNGQVWVYRHDGNSVRLVRIARSLGGMPSATDHSVIGGLTPSHTALHVAIKELRTKTGVKRCFHLTDGMPNTNQHADKFVRKNILEGRRFKVETFTLFIGQGVSRKSMGFLAGGPNCFASCGTDPKSISDAYADLVQKQFRKYLKEKA